MKLREGSCIPDNRLIVLSVWKKQSQFEWSSGEEEEEKEKETEKPKEKAAAVAAPDWAPRRVPEPRSPKRHSLSPLHDEDSTGSECDSDAVSHHRRCLVLYSLGPFHDVSCRLIVSSFRPLELQNGGG